MNCGLLDGMSSLLVTCATITTVLTAGAARKKMKVFGYTTVWIAANTQSRKVLSNEAW